MQQHRPDRLNLAIARRCFVACKGCYSFFGKHEPDLEAFLMTVAAFVRLGIHDVTLSGGDPLTIEGLNDFLVSIRALGVHTIKIDTVGTGFLFERPGARSRTPQEIQDNFKELCKSTNYFGIPLDGWSNASTKQFRAGRPFLYEETISLLTMIDALAYPPNVIINTVVHSQNIDGLKHILDEVSKHRSICHWNIFQYIPTDQATKQVNRFFEITDEQFATICASLTVIAKRLQRTDKLPVIAFQSVKARLGKYLLINSDGNAWLPDEDGNTIYLGNVFGREEVVLAQWSSLVHTLADRSMPLALS